jgi:hypothetical protein
MLCCKQVLNCFQMYGNDEKFMEAVGRAYKPGRSQTNHEKNGKLMQQNLTNMINGFARTPEISEDLLNEIKTEMALPELHMNHPAICDF